MAIYRLIANGEFGPEEIEAMTAAYESAFLDLRLTDRDDPITEIIAKTIVNITSTGERNPTLIKERAIKRPRDTAHRRRLDLSIIEAGRSASGH